MELIHRLLKMIQIYFHISENIDNEKYLVILNFTEKEIEFNPCISGLKDSKILICNYDSNPDINETGIMKLKPYEAAIYKLSE